jgi:hypothetical protein
MYRVIKLTAALTVVAAVLFSGYQWTRASVSVQSLTLEPGTGVSVSCPTRLRVRRSKEDWRHRLTVTCVEIDPTRTPPATRTAEPTNTQPAATHTSPASPTPEASVTRSPSKTPVPPTATAPSAGKTPTHAATHSVTATRTATRNATRTPTRTPVPPQPTSTQGGYPLPSATPQPPGPTSTPGGYPLPTSTHVHATATPPSSGGLDPVDPIILGTCPAAVHDRYLVAGPDGKSYRTWHPPTAPIDPTNAARGTCTFAHEHGDDPTTSQANPSLPPFGYVNAVAGHAEAHEGFKVFVANRGEVNDEGRAALGSSRVVFHMGTGGVKRFTESHHSAMIDLVMPTGHHVRVQGMFDTQRAGSICERDRSLNDNDPNNDIGRTVVVLEGNGCDGDSLYEIWAGFIDILRADGSVAARMGTAVAVFDPITVMDPADRTRLVYTADAFAHRSGEAPFTPPFHGCSREAYHAGAYWYNASGPTVYYTDAYGNPGGPLRQEISQHAQIGIDMASRADGNLNQFKLRKDYCAPGLGLKN